MQKNYKFSLAGRKINSNLLLFLGAIEVVRNRDARSVGPQEREDLSE
jgi:hypothetical protein